MHHDLGQAVLPAGDDQVVAVGLDTPNGTTGFMGHEIGPVVPSGVVDWNGGQHEIPGALAVVPDDESFAVIFYVVFEIGGARFYQHRY